MISTAKGGVARNTMVAAVLAFLLGFCISLAGCGRADETNALPNVIMTETSIGMRRTREFSGMITQTVTFAAGSAIEIEVTTSAGRLGITIVDGSGRTIYSADTSRTISHSVIVKDDCEFTIVIDGDSHSGSLLISWSEQH